MDHGLDSSTPCRSNNCQKGIRFKNNKQIENIAPDLHEFHFCHLLREIIAHLI